MSREDIKFKKDLQPGDMIIYPFLWKWEERKGNLKAYKMRPAVVVHRFDQNEIDSVIAILPITTQLKDLPDTRVIIPKREMLRVGMNTKVSQSICLHDCNLELIRTSRTLSNTVPIRTFSDSLIDRVQKKFRCAYERGLVEEVDRNKVREQLQPRSLPDDATSPDDDVMSMAGP